MDEQPAEFLSNEDVQRHFQGGPEVNKSAVLVMLGDRIYKREGDRWRLLDNRTYRTVKEMTDATGP